MPWFAVDDGFDTHPKVRKAGNAAAGLFCRLGAHCAKHLTEGLIDGATARDRGTAAQIQKLVSVGMLHAANHGCGRCQQPEPGGFVMHDYLEYNRSRKQVESAREHGRKRQAKGRERQAQTRTEPDSSTNRGPTAPQTEPQVGSDSDSFRAQNEPHFEHGTAGQGDASRRYTLEGGTAVPSQPLPSPVLPNGSTAAGAASERGGLPDVFADLKKALAAAGLGAVAWDIKKHSDWQRIQTQLDRLGVDLMVRSALNSSRAQGEPASVIAWIGRWQSLPDPKPALGSRDSPPQFDTPHCGHLDCDPDSRLREVERDGLPVLAPCPNCHPHTQGAQR